MSAAPSVITFEEMRAGRLADALELNVAAGGDAGLDAEFLTLAAVLDYGDRCYTVWRWQEDGQPYQPGLVPPQFGLLSRKLCRH